MPRHVGDEKSLMVVVIHIALGKIGGDAEKRVLICFTIAQIFFPFPYFRRSEIGWILWASNKHVDVVYF
jgi:hypothetical protein